MKVRMRTDITGTRDGKPWPKRGEHIELEHEEAVHLCAAGIADPVAEPEKPETAVSRRSAENRKR